MTPRSLLFLALAMTGFPGITTAAEYAPLPENRNIPSQTNNPGWNKSVVANSTEVSHYLERAGGTPYARRPDQGRVSAHGVHEIFDAEPALRVAQHPLESFGWSRPVKPGIPYAALPQNRDKFYPINAGDRLIRDQFWSALPKEKPFEKFSFP